jgi:hypothetical protein
VKNRPTLGDAATQGSVLGRPVSTTFRILSLVLATGIFFLSLAFWFKGNMVTDFAESNVPILAIEHGVPQCAYPVGYWTAVPPLYPLFAAGVMEATGIGRADIVSTGAASPSCRHLTSLDEGFPALPLVLIGVTGWPVIVAGFIAVLAVAGKSRTRWEVLGLGLMALTPAIASTLVRYLHPEDLFATGLILLATAAAIRSRWLAAGICIGVACCFKQFALLPAVPLLIAGPKRGRLRFALGAVGSVIVIVAPLCAVMGKGAWEVMKGLDATPSFSGTAVVGLLGLHGALLVFVSRILPLLVAGAMALWVRSRLGLAVARPQPLVGLVAVSLILRLVFEVNLFSYYFLATSVALIVLDIVFGRLRLETICWIVAVGGFYPPRFDPLVLVQHAHPSLVQVILVLPALALAALPLYRLCRAAEARPPGERLRLSRGVADARLPRQ